MCFSHLCFHHLDSSSAVREREREREREMRAEMMEDDCSVPVAAFSRKLQIHKAFTLCLLLDCHSGGISGYGTVFVGLPPPHHAALLPAVRAVGSELNGLTRDQLGN